jgi:hypothetical protein
MSFDSPRYREALAELTDGLVIINPGYTRFRIRCLRDSERRRLIKRRLPLS